MESHPINETQNAQRNRPFRLAFIGILCILICDVLIFLCLHFGDAALATYKPYPYTGTSIFYAHIITWVFYALIVLLNGIFFATLIHRKVKKGHFLPTEADYAEARAKYAGKKNPNASKLIALLWLFSSALETGSAWLNHNHPNILWVVAGLFWLNFFFWGWKALRDGRKLPQNVPDSPQ